MIVASVVGRVYNIETQMSKSGHKYVTGGLRDSFKNKDGEWESRFIRLTAFSGTGEILSTITPNDVVTVDGVLEIRTYVNNQSETKVSLEMVADRIRKSPFPKADDGDVPDQFGSRVKASGTETVENASIKESVEDPFSDPEPVAPRAAPRKGRNPFEH